jgi:predicted HTH transcriptional regulator
MPAIVLELKYNHTAETAITQIKDKRYTDSLLDYVGEVVLVGVNYDKRSKRHQCSIERVAKGSQSVGCNVPENVPEKRQRMIIEKIQSDPFVTIPKLAMICSVNEKTIKRDIQQLKSLGLLTRIGPAKGGWWKVRRIEN